MSKAIHPWSPYEGRTDYVSSGRKTLTSAFADLVRCRAGFPPTELPEIFRAPEDDGENDAARDLVRLNAELFAHLFATAKLVSFARPLGGGEVVALSEELWEIDDPLPRFATGAFNFDRWWDADTEPTHRIFVDAKQFDHWLADLKPLGPLTNLQVEAIVDPQIRAVRSASIQASTNKIDQGMLEDHESGPVPDPPGVGPALMTLKEVCDLTRRKSSTIYSDMNKGIFPEAVKLGSSSRWLKAEVLAYIAEQAGKRSKD